MADIFDAVASLQRRIANVRTAEFAIVADYVTVFASFATATLTATNALTPPAPPPSTSSSLSTASPLPEAFTPAGREAASAALHTTLGSTLTILRTAARRPPDEVVPKLVAALSGLTAYLHHLVAVADHVGGVMAAAGLAPAAVPTWRRRVGSTLVGTGKYRKWHLLMVERGSRQLAADAKAEAGEADDAKTKGGNDAKDGKEGGGGRRGANSVSTGMWHKIVGGSYRRQYETGHVNDLRRVIELKE